MPLNGDCSDILYYGFIGPNKGLEYALALHSKIRIGNPSIRMYVVGQVADSKSQLYFDSIKAKYIDGVSYLGFVQESELDNTFSSVSHVFLPFLDYKYYCPFSGSILAALCRGRIVWTNPVNAVNEIIENEINGRYFTGDTSNDAEIFLSLLSRREELKQLSLGSLTYCHNLYEKLKQLAEVKWAVQLR